MTPCWENLMIIPGEYDTAKWAGGCVGRGTNQPSRKHQILKLLSEGHTPKEVASLVGCNVSWVRRVRQKGG